jgi:anti-anti-sigma regulatory factor
LLGVLVLLLIGAIDTLHAQHMLEAEMEAITIHPATVMLVDIMGVPIVDTSVALQLIRAADMSHPEFNTGCHPGGGRVCQSRLSAARRR